MPYPPSIKTHSIHCPQIGSFEDQKPTGLAQSFVQKVRRYHHASPAGYVQQARVLYSYANVWMTCVACVAGQVLCYSVRLSRDKVDWQHQGDRFRMSRIQGSVQNLYEREISGSEEKSSSGTGLLLQTAVWHVGCPLSCMVQSSVSSREHALALTSGAKRSIASPTDGLVYGGASFSKTKRSLLRPVVTSCDTSGAHHMLRGEGSLHQYSTNRISLHSANRISPEADSFDLFFVRSASAIMYTKL